MRVKVAAALVANPSTWTSTSDKPAMYFTQVSFYLKAPTKLSLRHTTTSSFQPQIIQNFKTSSHSNNTIPKTLTTSRLITMAISDYITTEFIIGAAMRTFYLAGVLSLLVLILTGGESSTEYDGVILVWGIASFLWFVYKAIKFFKGYLRVSAAKGLNKVHSGDRIGGNRKERRKQMKNEDAIRRAGFSRL